MTNPKNDKQAAHICIVSPSLKMGGIERALSVLANYFVLEGYRITFIACLKTDPFYKLDSNIQLIQPEFKRHGSKWNKISFYPRLASFIRKEVKRANPDTVLSFGDMFNPLVLAALAGTGYPVYISDRTSPDFPFSRTIQMLKKVLYPNSAGFIAQTTRAAQFKRKIFQNKLNIITIPNAVRAVKQTGTERQKEIVCVARLVKEKSHYRLLEAFAALPNGHNWRLLLVGDGPLKLSLKRQSEALGIELFVDFVGDVKNVDDYLSSASVFVLPSHIEGFPNALCEAMANGLPSICFNTIPYEDVITHGLEGFVVNEDKPEDLSVYLERLMNNPALRYQMGSAARVKAEQFATKSIGKRYLDFILSK